ncbi:MAG TPA: HEAT repeat domain-containing protein, partial [Planctomycetaceae bacterium]|nr:HEAT repeat domain-containing protein [Planctomycetaceae bacterium]
PVLQKRTQQGAKGQPKRFEGCHAIVALTIDPSDQTAAESLKQVVRSSEEPDRIEDDYPSQAPLWYGIELLYHVHPPFKDVQPLGEYIAKLIDQIDLEHFDRPSEEMMVPVIAYSLLRFDAETKPHTLKRLQRVFDAALERKSLGVLPSGLALARLDADVREETLLKLISPGSIKSEAHVGALLLHATRWSRILVNRDVAVALAKQVENENPEISQSASWFLSWSGLAGGEAAPVLFKVLESDENQEHRVNAAIALAGICDPSNLPALQAAYNREKVSEVRKELDRAILGLRRCDGERLAH